MLAGAAVAARVAGDVVGGDDPVARRETREPVADLDDLARDLVTEDQRRFRLAIPLHDVGAAQPRGHDAEDQLALTRNWLGPLLEAHVTVRVVDRRPHRTIRDVSPS
jgi:hypothetical protein